MLTLILESPKLILFTIKSFYAIYISFLMRYDQHFNCVLLHKNIFYCFVLHLWFILLKEIDDQAKINLPSN